MRQYNLGHDFLEQILLTLNTLANTNFSQKSIFDIRQQTHNHGEYSAGPLRAKQRVLRQISSFSHRAQGIQLRDCEGMAADCRKGPAAPGDGEY